MKTMTFNTYTAIYAVARLSLDAGIYETLEEALEFTLETIDGVLDGSIEVEAVMDDEFIMEGLRMVDNLVEVSSGSRAKMYTNWGLIDPIIDCEEDENPDALWRLASGNTMSVKNKTDYRLALELDMLPLLDAEVPHRLRTFITEERARDLLEDGYTYKVFKDGEWYLAKPYGRM